MAQDNNNQRKKVGLALSGGFIRAAAQIGVIEVLEENGIAIDMVAGCSSGSAVGAAYSAGRLDKLKERLLNGKRREYWKIIFEPGLPRTGFLKGERNRKFFEEFVGDKTFDQLDKKTFLVATDLKNMKECVIDSGKVGRAIQACTAVPGIFSPVEWNDQILIDGVNFNAIPSKVLYQNGADYVIAVDVTQPVGVIVRMISGIKKRLGFNNECNCRECRNLNIIRSIIRATNLSATKIDGFKYSSYPYNILIKPDVEYVKRWHVSLVKDCIKEGRRAALEAIPQIKKDLVID